MREASASWSLARCDGAVKPHSCHLFSSAGSGFRLSHGLLVCVFSGQWKIHDLSHAASCYIGKTIFNRETHAAIRPGRLNNQHALKTAMIKTNTISFPSLLKHVGAKLPAREGNRHAPPLSDWTHAGADAAVKPRHANLPDAVWSELRACAAAMSLKEPFLSPMLRRLVLRQPSLPDALIAVLAHQMHSKELSESLLCKLMRSLFRSDATIAESLAADLAAVKERDPACPDYLHVLLNLKGFHALQVHRLCHLLWNHDRKELAFHIANAASRIYSIDIHPAARIGSGVMLDHGTGIVIGETTVIEDNVSILQEVTLGGTGKESGDRHPKVRRGVMIGAGAKILGNIEIGAMSKVAAGSVVLHSVPPYSTVAGVPARVVRQAPVDTFPSFEMDQSV